LCTSAESPPRIIGLSGQNAGLYKPASLITADQKSVVPDIDPVSGPAEAGAIDL